MEFIAFITMISLANITLTDGPVKVGDVVMAEVFGIARSEKACGKQAQDLAEAFERMGGGNLQVDIHCIAVTEDVAEAIKIKRNWKPTEEVIPEVFGPPPLKK